MSRQWWIAGLAAVALSVSAHAQDNERAIAVSYNLDVKLANVMQFEAALKEQASWYRQNNETWHWHAWEWATGPNVGSYVFRSPGHTLADFDRRSQRQARARDNFMKLVGPHLDGMQGMMVAAMSDISNWPEDMGDVPMVQVYSFTLNYGMNEQFEHAIGRIHEAIMASNWDFNYAWLASMSGGDVGHYVAVVPMKSFTDLAPPEQPFWKMIEGSLGSVEARALREALSHCVKEETSAMAKFRPDLSYMPNE